MDKVIELVSDIIANNQAQMSIALMMQKTDMEIVVSLSLLVAVRLELGLHVYPTSEEVSQALRDKLAEQKESE